MTVLYILNTFYTYKDVCVFNFYILSRTVFVCGINSRSHNAVILSFLTTYHKSFIKILNTMGTTSGTEIAFPSRSSLHLIGVHIVQAFGV